MPTFNNVIKYVDQLLQNSQSPDIQWRVVYTHRPINCAEEWKQDCDANMFMLKSFEELYRKYGFDAMLAGHLHSYQQLSPMDTDLNIVQGSSTNVTNGIIYKDLQVPVTIISGCSGNEEGWPVVLDNTTMQVSAFTNFPCFNTMEITDNTFNFTMVRADTMQNVWSTVISKSSPPAPVDKSLWTSVAILSAFLGVVLLAFLFVNRGSLFKSGADEEDQAASKLHYSVVKSVDSHIDTNPTGSNL